jgi:uncharacterized membrane protein
MVAVDARSPARAAVVIPFVLVCPGQGFARLLQLDDKVAELTIGLGLSVAIASAVALGMIYSGLWSPQGGVAALIALTLVANGAEARQWRSGPSRLRRAGE